MSLEKFDENASYIRAAIKLGYNFNPGETFEMSVVEAKIFINENANAEAEKRKE